MILGLISDTHGQRQRTAAALSLLRQLDAEALVHCGDFGDVEDLDDLAGWRAWVVPGNVDRLDPAMIQCAESLGVVLATQVPLRIELAGRSLLVFHGHEPAFRRVMTELLESGAVPAELAPCDYLLHGHTHHASATRAGPVRVINPGALLRAAEYTVATLDLHTDRVRFWRVSDDPTDQPVEFHRDWH